jgi:hypothetical protein
MLDVVSRLDARSQRALGGFGLRAGFFTAIGLLPLLAGSGRWTATATALQTMYLYAAFLAVIFAKLRREPPSGPSLTLWDEALALSSLGLLVHTVRRLAL